jgi:hypothetical protein
VVGRIALLLLAASVSSLVCANAPGRHSPVYQPLTVRDFEIDADVLVANHKRIEITGAYTTAGQLDELYANITDVALVKQGLGSPPFIPLLTAHASRGFRAAMFDCRSSGAYSCMFIVRGIATRCSIVNGFGVTQEAACIAVEDGEAYSPRP